MCKATDPIGCAIQTGANDALSGIAESFGKAAGWAIKTMTTAWLGLPSPDLTSAGSAAGWLDGEIGWVIGAVALASTLLCAYRMATSGKFEHAVDLGGALFRVVVVMGAAAFVTTVLLQAGDLFSVWLIRDTPAPASTVLGMAFNPAGQAAGGIPPGLVLLLAVVVLLAQLIQVCLMFLKSGMVVLLVGFLPLTAAVSNLPTGRQAWQKAVGWLLAFVLYKPVAAMVYALSFKLMDHRSGILGELGGVALMVAAIFALPALLKFCVPAVAAASGGNAGGIAGATVGAAIATGAVVATGGLAGAAGGFAGAGGQAASLSRTASTGPSGAQVLSSGMQQAGAGAQKATEEAVQ